MSINRIADDLAAILARPTDAPGLKGRNPKRLAISLLGKALNPDHNAESANFEQPIEVVDLRGPLQLFRMFDWRLGDIWGDWWIEADLLKQMVEVADRKSSSNVHDRQARVLQLFRSSVCVSPGWKKLYSDVARLDLSYGRAVPAVRGRSSPRALKMSATEMEDVLGQLFLPGGVQYFIPHDFIKRILVQKVQRSSPNWPFF
jgi:hypothetical protein